MTKKLWLVAALMAPLAVYAQQQTGSVHGHAQDPAGIPLANAQIQVSTDGKTALYTFTADANGDYKGDNIKPGTYVLTMFIKGPNDAAPKPVDRFETVKIDAGANATQDFDLSRPEYVKKLPPEEQKAIADAKAKNASILKENSQVKNLNADLATARQDIKDKKFDEAATLMQRDSTAKPDAAVLWVELAIAQNGLKKYDDAITSAKKAIETNAASKKPSPEIEGAANNTLGEAYAGKNQIPDATAAYDAAAKAQPTNAGMFFSNEAIILAKSGANADAVAAAADKAIAADPNKPVPYYLKGQALIAKATVDPKTNRIVAPPGCEEAYEKYLQLDPNGPMAADAKNILEQIGSKQAKSYKAK
ncbi:MAG TPA: carboxypeptidase regulatory-like domain-containing protein [Acidobacteriaceae bacterium]|jgi:tetratricopeptide (TPR) repeat protein|nr:carboxypeptidase regulatory-like domain-containing protein [Acidobacteriaceae bacterium]